MGGAVVVVETVLGADTDVVVVVVVVFLLGSVGPHPAITVASVSQTQELRRPQRLDIDSASCQKRGNRANPYLIYMERLARLLKDPPQPGFTLARCPLWVAEMDATARV